MTAALARLRTLLAYVRLRRHYGKRVGWPTCPVRTGSVSICGPGEPERGRILRCQAPVSRLRWVLHGHCGQHGDGR